MRRTKEEGVKICGFVTETAQGEEFSMSGSNQERGLGTLIRCYFPDNSLRILDSPVFMRVSHLDFFCGKKFTDLFPAQGKRSTSLS